MKKVVFLFLLSFIFAGTYAQFGIKVGANTTTLKISSTDNVIDEVKNADWGFNAGLFYRLKIALLYIQPEAYFSTVGGSFHYNDVNAGDVLHSFDLKRIDIPLVVGVKLGPIRIHAAPVAFFTVSSKSSLTDFEEAMKGTTWGYQAGLGIDLLKKLTFDARYEGSLGDFTESVTIGGHTLEPSTKSSAFLLSVGFMF
jgi:opacity protein-like surface antigen